MLKKLIIGFLILISGFYLNVNYVSAEKCSGSGCISSTEFIVPISTFGNGKIAGVDITNTNSTESTMSVLLGVIIKNLIVIFGVLSLLVMTIGGGYMIFHVGEESLLSRGKSIFMYGLVSLAIALSAGLIVQLITYILY
ncbi:hypothetical protein LR004_00825 [Candidatus Gracilibacteria bacterium]|nr:hypothetical protein [Candidatus Gracilibacteria bacterium]